jgi:hypothetical protein
VTRPTVVACRGCSRTRARQPKELRYLSYDQAGLYAEPGLSDANAAAIEFFHAHLGGKI